MVKQIPLTKGKVALVDDADFEHLNQWKWHYNPVCRTGYARRIATIDGKRTLIYMHHDILGIPALGMEADHISTDGCDNRRENLRWGTRAQNLMNSRKRGGGVPGSRECVGIHRNSNGWLQSRLAASCVIWAFLTMR